MTRCIIVELRPRIRVCNVFILTKVRLIEKEQIKVSIKSLSISVSCLANESKLEQTFVLPDTKLIPTSLSGLQVCGDSISFRVQTEPLTNISGSFAAEIIPLRCTSYDQNVPKFVPSIVPNIAHSLVCKCCGNKLSVTDVTVKRVLPLPADSSSQFEWFCHNHNDCNSSDASEVTILDVKESDCLYGTCFFLLHTAWLKMRKSEVLLCTRCFSWLGTCNGTSAKLWQCTTIWGNNSVSQTALDDFFTVIKEAVYGTMGMLCKIILETKLTANETQYILLWVLDKDLQVFVHINDSEQLSQCNYKAGTEITLISRKTMKVLYNHHVCCDDTVKLWQKDLNVHSIDISKQMFVEGLQYLVKVTKYLPASHRMSRNFYVAHLGL